MNYKTFAEQGLENRLFHACNIARMAYWNREGGESAIKDYLITQGIETVQCFENKDSGVEWMVCESNGVQFLAFRGTAGKKDLKTDMKSAKVKTPYGDIHEGFYNAFNSVSISVTKLLDDKKPVIVCGHSYGGALATIASYILTINGYNVVRVYTFGSPRVGDGTFAKLYNKKLAKVTLRIVNNNDIVPRIPFKFMILPLGYYVHVETGYYITTEGKLKLGVSYFRDFGDHMQGVVDKEKEPEELADHDITGKQERGYFSQLEKLSKTA